jgi:heme ABC exporter ATP-binding subunit CcmA
MSAYTPATPASPPAESPTYEDLTEDSTEDLTEDSTQDSTREPAQEPVVEFSGLTKRYDLRPVLRNVSYSLRPGQVLALLGPNGAGKTTLLRILATLCKPSAGWASVGQYNVVADAGEVRRLVGYVGHQPAVYADLTGLENLRFFARMYNVADREARANLLLERVGLRARARDRVRTYSRGQVQRLALARGLLHDPRVLLLDEPDTGLDEEALFLLSDLVEERRSRRLATLFTTHQLERGLSLADEALVLVGGRLVYAGGTAELSVAAVRRLYTGERTAGITEEGQL